MKPAAAEECGAPRASFHVSFSLLLLLPFFSSSSVPSSSMLIPSLPGRELPPCPSPLILPSPRHPPAPLPPPPSPPPSSASASSECSSAMLIPSFLFSGRRPWPPRAHGKQLSRCLTKQCPDSLTNITTPPTPTPTIS